MLPRSTLEWQDAGMRAKVKRSYHHGNLRAVLIEAGLALIAEKGVRALTLREIGAKVGVSRMAAYRHFADKAQLLSAIRAAGFERFVEALEGGRSVSMKDVKMRLSGMGVAYVSFARQHPAYFEVMFSMPPEGQPEEACAAEKRAFQILEETVIEGQTKGFLRQGDARLMAHALWSLVHGMSALKLDQLASAEGVDPDQFVIACSHLLLIGLQATKK
jgi:AcrR family transcriptional regulator